jgi:hypothetical protein
MGGMVNKSELSINVVISDKPKALGCFQKGHEGLSQKASGQDEGFAASLTQMQSHRRIGST